MKKILSIAIVLASTAVFAQSSSTTAAATAAEAKGESTTPDSSIKSTGSPETTIGTSTASVKNEPVPKSKFSASIVSQGEYAGEQIQRVGETTISLINFAGVGYEIAKDTKLGVRQYFAFDIGRESSGYAETQFSILTLGTKFAGIAGSEPIAPLFWYYLPTKTAIENVYSKVTPLEHNGIIRADAEIAWTLNPKWQVSYYLNPRQSIVPKAQAYVDNATGKTKIMESTTTLIHYGYLYYNVNDAIQPYGYVGMDNRMRTSDQTSIRDHALLAIGANFTTLGGKLILNPEIYNKVVLKEDGKYAEAPRWLQNDDLTYQMTAALLF